VGKKVHQKYRCRDKINIIVEKNRNFIYKFSVEKIINKIIKKSIILLFYIIVFYFSIVYTYVFLKEHTEKYGALPIYEILILTLHFIVYFSLRWKNLYSKGYPGNYNFAYKIVIKNLSISTMIIITIVVGVYTLQSLHQNIQLLNLKRLTIYILVSVLIFFVLHILEIEWIKYLSRLGYFKRKVLIVGNSNKRFPLDKFLYDIGNTREYAGKIVFNNGKCFLEEKNISLKYPDIEKIILEKNISEIFIFKGKEIDEKIVLKIKQFCKKFNICYTMLPDGVGKFTANHYPNYIPVIEKFSTPKDLLINVSIKRLLDIIISAVALLCFMPIGIIIAIAIKLEDRGPIFYVSKRVGKNGKIIKFYKFRSMIVNAEKKQRELLKYNERKDGPLFKMKNDPRVTKVGRILRKYSLDEVPQLINVLKGDMSIVGPRPHLPEEVKAYKGTDYLRLECIPGIVCLPQIYGRNHLGFREWIDLDLQYRQNWSVTLDLRIMLKAVKVILSPLFSKENYGF